MKKQEFKAEQFSIIEVGTNNIPSFVETKGKDWISFGLNNNFPQYLIEIFNRSAKHNAIVVGKTSFIKGSGLLIKSDYQKKMEAQIFLENMNSFIDSNELLERVILDLELFNGFYLELTPDLLGKAVAKVDHIDFSKIRISKCKKLYLYSNDWNAKIQSYEKTGLRKIEPYNFQTKSGLWVYKGYRPGVNIYPLPEYIGAIPYIEIDYEVSNFHLNNIKSGFSAGTLLSFNAGKPSEEAQKTIEKRVKDKYTGTKKAGQLMITFADSKDTAPTVTSLHSNNFGDLFQKLNETALQEIFTGHRITSLAIFGIKEAKGLGSKDELATAFQLLQNTYITNKQEIVTKTFNEIAAQAGIFGNPFEIKKVKTPGQWLEPSDIIKVMTPEEIRKEAGLQVSVTEMKKEGKYDIENFKKFGRPKSECKILKRIEVADREQVLLGELSIFKSGFAKILYSYEEREGLPPLIGEHRDFCQELIDLDRLYTRQEIDMISELEGRDVWKTRGGFYHNPKTDRTTPYCRHIWTQNIVE